MAKKRSSTTKSATETTENQAATEETQTAETQSEETKTEDTSTETTSTEETQTEETTQSGEGENVPSESTEDTQSSDPEPTQDAEATDDTVESKGADLHGQTVDITPQQETPKVSVPKDGQFTEEYQKNAPEGLAGIGYKLGQYIDAMQPHRPQDSATLQQHQLKLRGVVNNVLDLPDEKFAEGMKFLIGAIRKHRNGVFNELYLFRGFESMRTARVERQKLEQLLSLFLATADSKSPTKVKDVVDLRVVFKYVTNNDHQQKLQSYYGDE